MSGSGNILTRPRREGKYSKLSALRLLPGWPNIDVTALLGNALCCMHRGRKGPGQGGDF